MSDQGTIHPERFGWTAEDLAGVEFEDDPDETWPVDLPDTSYDHAQHQQPDDQEDEE